jgi:hypothetical protein
MSKLYKDAVYAAIPAVVLIVIFGLSMYWVIRDIEVLLVCVAMVCVAVALSILLANIAERHAKATVKRIVSDIRRVAELPVLHELKPTAKERFKDYDFTPPKRAINSDEVMRDSINSIPPNFFNGKIKE